MFGLVFSDSRLRASFRFVKNEVRPPVTLSVMVETLVKASARKSSKKPALAADGTKRRPARIRAKTREREREREILRAISCCLHGALLNAVYHWKIENERELVGISRWFCHLAVSPPSDAKRRELGSFASKTKLDHTICHLIVTVPVTAPPCQTLGV